ncbi:MAG: hypothetical protein PVH63_10235 [Balneolaceae bacterium]
MRVRALQPKSNQETTMAHLAAMPDQGDTSTKKDDDSTSGGGG